MKSKIFASVNSTESSAEVSTNMTDKLCSYVKFERVTFWIYIFYGFCSTAFRESKVILITYI